MITASDNQTALEPGYIIQPYTVIKVLGRGDFGITYLAQDNKRNRLVVLKEYFPVMSAVRATGQITLSILSSSDKQSDFAEGLRRFLREAMVLSEIHHPNIVEVIALFEDNNTAYFVMEYINGESLQQLVNRLQGPLSEELIYRHLIPVLYGLSEIHKKGMLHLDIKPDNILLTEYGEPVLIDFDGAWLATRLASHDVDYIEELLEEDSYSSQEKYTRYHEQTRATDLYAFGMTLYHLMAPSEKLPNGLDRFIAVVENQRDPLKPVRSVAPGYSDALYGIVEFCTQIRKQDRPQSVSEILAVLPAKPHSFSSDGRTQAVSDRPESLSPAVPVAEPAIQTSSHGSNKGTEEYRRYDGKSLALLSVMGGLILLSFLLQYLMY